MVKPKKEGLVDPLGRSREDWKKEQLTILESKKQRLQLARRVSPRAKLSKHTNSSTSLGRRTLSRKRSSQEENTAIVHLTRLLAKFQGKEETNSDTLRDTVPDSVPTPPNQRQDLNPAPGTPTQKRVDTSTTTSTRPASPELIAASEPTLSKEPEAFAEPVVAEAFAEPLPEPMAEPFPEAYGEVLPCAQPQEAAAEEVTKVVARRPPPITKPQLINPLHSRPSRRDLKSASRATMKRLEDARKDDGQDKRDDSTTVQQYLESMGKFIPFRIMEMYINHASMDDSRISVFHEEIEAAVLFADMSGFSKLAEELESKVGRTRAAKSLGESVATALKPLVNLIVEFGGDVIKFAGDAMFAVYDVKTHGDLAMACTSACLTARKMVMFHNHNAANNIGFQVHCGVGVGVAIGLHVGGYRQRWEYAITGEPLQQSVSCEGDASAGEVVVSSEVRGFLSEMAQVELVPESGNYKLISMLGETLGRHRERTTQRIADAIKKMDPASLHSLYRYVMPYVPEPVIDSIDCGKGVWVGSVRRCVTIFLRLKGIEYKDPEDIRKIHVSTRLVQKNMYAFPGCTFCRLIVDDKGLTNLWAFGMTNAGTHNYAVYAVTAAFSIYEALKAIGQSCAVGITSGRVYCGTVGGLQRCEYTLHGTQVNLAARLMVGAKDGVLVDQEVFDATNTAYDYDPPVMMQFKGKSHQIKVYRPKQRESSQAPRPRAASQPAGGPSSPMKSNAVLPSLDMLKKPSSTSCITINDEKGFLGILGQINRDGVAQLTARQLERDSAVGSDDEEARNPWQLLRKMSANISRKPSRSSSIQTSLLRRGKRGSASSMPQSVPEAGELKNVGGGGKRKFRFP